jgi:hypothetical protein
VSKLAIAAGMHELLGILATKVVKIVILTWHRKYNTNSDRKIVKS